MEEKPQDRTPDLPDGIDPFAYDTEASDPVEDTLLSGLADDARLGSGVPGEQRLSETDFIALSGVTQPRPKAAVKPSAKAEPPVDDSDSGQFVSFAEPGVADVEESDESEPLARGDIPIQSEPIDLEPEAVEESTPLESVSLAALSEATPAQEDDDVEEAYIALDNDEDEEEVIEFAAPAEDFSKLIDDEPPVAVDAPVQELPEEAVEKVSRSPRTSIPVRTRLEEAEHLLHLLSSQPKESTLEALEPVASEEMAEEIEEIPAASKEQDDALEEVTAYVDEPRPAVEEVAYVPEPDVALPSAHEAEQAIAIPEPVVLPDEVEEQWQESLFRPEPVQAHAVEMPTPEEVPVLSRPLAYDEPSLLGAPAPQQYGQHEHPQPRVGNDQDAAPSRMHTTRYVRRRKRMLMRIAIVLCLVAIAVCGYVAYHEFLRPRILSPDELYAKATNHMVRHQYLEASNRFAEFAQRAPDHANRPDAHFNAALALHMNAPQNVELRHSQVAQAAALLEDFIRENPGHKKLPRARSLLGILYYENGKHEQAIEMLRELVRQLEDQLAALPVLRTLARAYGKSGALEEAENMYLQAASMQKNYTPDVDYFELGELYQRRAELEEDIAARDQLQARAIKYFTLAMESPVVDPDTRNAIGEAVAALNRRVESAAQSAVEKPVISAAPEIPEVPPEIPPAASGQDINPVLEAQQLGQITIVQP